MSRRGGAYENYADQPSAGWTTHDQHDWLYPPDDELGVPYEDDFTPVTGGRARWGSGAAPAGHTVEQGAPGPSSPSAGGPLPDPTLDIEAPVGSRDRRQ